MEDVEIFHGNLAEHIAEALRERRYGDDRVYDVWKHGSTIIVKHADRAPYDIAVIKVKTMLEQFLEERERFSR